MKNNKVNDIFARLQQRLMDTHYYSKDFYIDEVNWKKSENDFRTFIHNMFVELHTMISSICKYKDSDNLTLSEIKNLNNGITSVITSLIDIGNYIFVDADKYYITKQNFNKCIQPFLGSHKVDKLFHLLNSLGLCLVDCKNGSLQQVQSTKYHNVFPAWKVMSAICKVYLKSSWKKNAGIDIFARCNFQALSEDFADNAYEKCHLDHEDNISYLDQLINRARHYNWNIMTLTNSGVDAYTLVYEPEFSTIHLTVEIIHGNIIVNIPFRAESLLNIFEHMKDNVKDFIVRYMKPYTYCSADFCCGDIDFFLQHKEKKYKICHSDEFCPNLIVAPCDDELSCEIICVLMDNIFKDFKPCNNKYDYQVNVIERYMLLGYMHNANPLNKSTEEFIEECMYTTEGVSKMDALFSLCGTKNNGIYLGATTAFVDGSNYNYVFGIRLEREVTINQLQEGMVLVEIQGGEYVTIESRHEDYNGLWKYFQYTFKPLSKVQKDITRYTVDYVVNGRVHSISIPICDQQSYSNKDVDYIVTSAPTFKIAGVTAFTEKGHPMYKSMEEAEKIVRGYYPDSKTIMYGKIHAYLGKSYKAFVGIPIEPDHDVPEGLEKIDITGGLWGFSKPKYFNSYKSDEYIPDNYLQTASSLLFGHPRAYFCIDTKDRAGYSLTAMPLKSYIYSGNYEYEVYQRDECYIAGKAEQMDNPVTQADFERFGKLNPEDTYYVSTFYNITRLFSPSSKNTPYFKGAIINQQVCTENDEFEVRSYEGGKYARVYEKVENGEPDWYLTIYVTQNFSKDSGLYLDNKRPCFIYHKKDKSSFEIHVPVK